MSGRRHSSLAPTRPPTIAAAELPMPLHSGIRLISRTVSRSGMRPACAKTRSAARTTRFPRPVGSDFSPRPFTVTQTFGSPDDRNPPAVCRITSLQRFTASPRQSKPGPRLAAVAGTVTCTEFGHLQSGPFHHRVERGRHGRDFAGGLDRAFRVLQAVARQNADDRRFRPVREETSAGALDQSRDRRGGGRLGEDALEAAEHPVGGDDFVVGDQCQ